MDARLVRIALGLAAVLGVGFLTGCGEPSGLSPVAISRDEGGLLIAVCVDVEIENIYGETKSSQDSEWNEFLDVSGSYIASSGTIISVSALPSELAGRSSPVDFGSLRSIALTITDPGGGWGADFGRSETLEVPDDAWLQTDGEITPQPCT
jgi:hypothetical protein